MVDLKDSVLEFPENRGHLRKSKTPQKIAGKVDFPEPRLYNAPALHIIDTFCTKPVWNQHTHSWKKLNLMTKITRALHNKIGHCQCECKGFFFAGLVSCLQIGDRDRGGSKTYRTLEGGGNSPRKLPLEDGLVTPKLAIFYRNSVERVNFRGPWKFKELLQVILRELLS